VDRNAGLLTAGTADDHRQLAIDGKPPSAAADQEGDAARGDAAADGKKRVKGEKHV
jgi:hypothetical protein